MFDLGYFYSRKVRPVAEDTSLPLEIFEELPFSISSSNYWFLSSKLVEILSVVLDEYVKGEKKFEEATDELNDIYIDLWRACKYLPQRDDFDQIEIGAFTQFKNLRMPREHLIEGWHIFSKSIYEQLTELEGNVNKELVSKSLRGYFLDVDPLIEDHKRRKLNLLHINNLNSGLLIDQVKSQLIYKTLVIDVQLEIQPIKFLHKLCMERDTIVSYLDMAKSLGINSYFDGVMQKDIQKPIQNIRKALPKYLESLHIKKKYVDEIMNLIQSKTNIGYKLVAS